MEDDPIITPEEEEIDDVEFVEGEATPKVSKKKIIKVEENRSKREHVNVVFIGHVGKSRMCQKIWNYFNTLCLLAFQMLVNQQLVGRSCR